MTVSALSRATRASRAARTSAAAGILGIGIVGVGGLAAGVASAAGTTDPPANITPPTPLCGDLSPQCIATDLGDINAARAGEGVGPMTLPAGFASLNGAAQLLVVIDAERGDRGLPTFPGLDPSLEAAAQIAAQRSSDPAPSAGYPWDRYGGLWAGVPSALFADYLWMYDDGPGGTNIGCGAAGGGTCWGHRESILSSWATGPSDVPAMGAAVSGGSSWTVLFASNTAGGPTTLDDPYAAVVGPGSGVETSVPASGISATDVGGQSGYYVTNRTGEVRAFGAAAFHGDLTGVSLNAPIISITATADGGGYWLLAADGGVFSFGDAAFHGSTGGMPLNAPVVSMAPTPDGGGYWIVARDGGVFSFGDAAFHGSTGGMPLNQPVDGMAVGPGGHGYWLVASDGGVFSFGEPFVGSLGATALNRPIIGISSGAGGDGYTLVGSDGGVFDFDTPFFGSLGANPPSTPVTALATTPDDGGYYMVDAAGQVFAFGDAVYAGGL